ncbi:MAG: helicase C-terminal domain-containing protein [Verrucomicrobiota bacterium]
MIAPLDAPLSSQPQWVDSIRDLFGETGGLGAARNFEFRPQQQAMAAATALALAQRGHLVCEAPTGVGKSLAYLVPAALYAIDQNRKAVVSTHTINLQEQLIHKDIPLTRRLLETDFEAVLLKGRQNYLCPRRLERAMASAGDLFVKGEQTELQRLWDWSLQTKDGTLSDLPSAPSWSVWSQVCSEPHVCTARTCGNDPRCCYQQTRKKVETARLVVVNHSLFFTLLQDWDEEHEGEDGYLFANDFVILDEAHTLENVAARHLGLDISEFGVRRLLTRLFNPKTKKGLLATMREGDSIHAAKRALEAVELFFGALENTLAFGKQREVRLMRTDIVENTVAAPLARLESHVRDLAADARDETLKAELADSARRLAALGHGVAEVLRLEREDHVYWVEKTFRSRRPELQILSAPVEVAPYLRRLLFRPRQSVVVTSATLSTGRGLSYFQQRLGAEVAETLQVDSPFDLERQMRVAIPKTMPLPTDRARYDVALADWIRHFTRETNGGAFVLFTSYASLSAIAQKLEPFFREEGMHFLRQGGDKPRSHLLEEFKRTPNSVLFGTDSFWQGVDVPGDALRNVIITRLPFAVPDHPLTAAKLEHIERQGGNPFGDYSVPEAILKFRQGVGRLIRTKQDRGLVAILDNRVLTKGYGKSFLAVLPKCPVDIVDRPEE